MDSEKSKDEDRNESYLDKEKKVFVQCHKIKKRKNIRSPVEALVVYDGRI